MGEQREQAVASEGEWRDFAACRRSRVDFFDEQQEAAAVRVCASCPVLQPCRETALAERPPEGVWGGLTPRDRRVLWLRSRSAGRAGQQHQQV